MNDNKKEEKNPQNCTYLRSFISTGSTSKIKKRSPTTLTKVSMGIRSSVFIIIKRF